MSSPFIDRLGWCLVHFVWQGTIVALSLGLGLMVSRHGSARFRYGLSCASLLVLALCPVATFFVLLAGESTPIPAGRVASTVAARAPHLTHIRDGFVGIASPHKGFDLHGCLPVLVFLWGVGVLLLSIRLLGGLMQVERLKRKHSAAAADEWQARLNALAESLGIHRSVRLLMSAKVEVPVAMGIIRAIVILPCSITLRLSSQEIEALLAHELAHIRRHDYVVNLLQSVIETTLFYHPAVWWVSRMVRLEREHCCDDVAATAAGNPVVYAKALTSLEELRGAVPNLTMSSNGGFLMTRISRILGIANPSLRTSRVLPSLAALFGMAAILGFVVQGAAQSNPPPKKPAVKHSKLLAATHKVVKSSKLLANKSAVKGQVYADTIMRALVKPNQSTSIVKAIAPKVTQKPDPKSMVTWLAARHDGRSDQARSSIKEWFDLADKAHTKDAKNSPAQPHSPSDTATADLLNADFAEAIQTVARQTGTSFVIAPEKFPKVSVKLVDMPFVEALNAICFAGEASWRRQGNIYYFFHRKEGQDTITDRATVEFEHVTLTEAVGRLARLYGADIEMPERDTRGNIPVIRVDLDNRTISESLFAVCQIVGANWHCEDGVYKISWPH